MKPLLHIALGFLVLLGSAVMCRAQEPSDATAAPAPIPIVLDNASTPSAATTWREQTIYIPYKQLQKVFEEQGRGVFLPYEKFQELWRKAQAAEPKPVDERPPLGAIITEIASEATVARDVINVQASVQIELLSAGWHEVPLRLSDAAIRGASIEGQPARILFQPQQGYHLLVKNDTEGSRSLTLELEYAKVFTKSPGQNSVSWEAPQASVNRWRIRIPQAGVKVNIHPLIAATEAPVDAPAEEPQTTDETVVLAFVGAAPTVRIDWTPKMEGASGLEALATVQAVQEVTIEEGVARTRTRLTYAISRAELTQLVLEVPADQKVTHVIDPNVKRWEVEVDEQVQRITIELFEPARGVQHVTLELERFHDEQSLRDLRVPGVRANNVAQQQGTVLVRLSDELRAEPTTKTGLLQMDTAELPEPLRNASWAYAYRYAAFPFELALNVEKIKPRVRVRQLVEAYLEPEQLTLDVSSIWDIQQAGIFQVDYDIPGGYEVQSVQGQTLGDAAAASVDAHHLEGDGNTRLRINLSRKALGKIGLVLTLRRSLNDPQLLTPTGVAADVAIDVPRVATAIDDIEGGLVVLATESLQITPKTQGGLRTVAITEAQQFVPSVRQGRFPALREVLAFHFQRGAAELQVAAERRRPLISSRQLLTARIEPGVIKYQATFFYDILYSAVKSLRIDVPSALAGDIRISTPGVNKTLINPQPDDVLEGDVAWSLSGDNDWLGSRSTVLAWDRTTPELNVGQSTSYELPRLGPRQVDRAWGQIVVSKAETLDIRPTAGWEGLRPIDPQHDLMPNVSVADAALAFEFHDAWNLAITATRYELEEVKRTSVERALVRMVVTRSDRISVQALYRLRSTLQRLAVELPEGSEFDNDPLYINGEPKSLEHGEDNQLFIPLTDQTPDQSFVLELRYTTPGTHRQLDLPYFPGQEELQTAPAVQKVELVVYLPQEMLLLAARGPWTNQQEDWRAKLNRLPGHPSTDEPLLNWVLEGVTMNTQRVRNFAIDGWPYHFTTLQPAPPPQGSLRLVAWDSWLMNLSIFGGLACVGLAFAWQSASRKLIVITLLLAGLVLVGVFAPMLAMRLLDVYLLVGLALLCLGWIVAAVVEYQRRIAASSGIPATNPQLVTNEGTIPDSGESPFPPATPPEDQPSAGHQEGGSSDV